MLKSTLGFEHDGVLNPAVIEEGNDIHLFYRAVGKGNYSTIGHAKLSDPLTIAERQDSPVLFPQLEAESHGVEDPRIVKIEGLFYLTYTAYDGVNALGALATSTDLVQWTKQGTVMVPEITYPEFNRLAGSREQLNEKYLRYNGSGGIQEKKGKKVLLWDKNVMFYPRKINGKFFFLHRIKPDIQLVCVPELNELTPEFWQNYFLYFSNNIVLSSKHDFEISYLGGGCPPIETPHGWLLIYHGVCDSTEGYVYSACAALFDLENPTKEIGRLPYPLFKPEETWELNGEVNNVCFPTGTVLRDDTLYIYYGAADEQIAVASVRLSALLKELLQNTTAHEKRNIAYNFLSTP